MHTGIHTYIQRYIHTKIHIVNIHIDIRTHTRAYVYKCVCVCVCNLYWQYCAAICPKTIIEHCHIVRWQAGGLVGGLGGLSSRFGFGKGEDAKDAKAMNVWCLDARRQGGDEGSCGSCSGGCHMPHHERLQVTQRDQFFSVPRLAWDVCG